MAATHLLLCFILCLIAPVVCQQLLLRLHVSEEGHPVTVLCPHDGAYTKRSWIWSGALLLRPNSVIYRQYSGEAVVAAGARPDMSLNLTDWSLTIGSLQVEDTWRLYCVVYTGGQSLYAWTYLVVYNRWVDVRHNTSLTLQCPVTAADFTTRQWYTWPFASFYLLYNQNTSGVTKGSYAARDDMSLDTDSFNLTIGRVRLRDYIFTCRITKQQTTNVGIIFPAIYSVVFEAEENTSVTLPCDKVQELTSQRTGHYTRTWQRVNGDVLYLQYLYDGVFYELSAAARADMSLNNETFTLTIGTAQLEDSTMFVCTFTPSHYIQSVKLIINNQNPSTSPPFTNGVSPPVKNEMSPPVTDGELPSDTSEVPPPVTGGLSPYVIGGAVAAAAAITIIIIVISVCVCVRRRKVTVNRVSDETRKTSESHHRHGMVAPDVTSHGETYLPRADYHEYAEIPAQAQVPHTPDHQQYEIVQTRLNEKTPIDKWFKEKAMSPSIVKKLKRHKIITIQDLQDMSREDMVEAGLKVGERNQIKRVLGDSATSRF